MDALILSACIPRPVRFVMYYKIFNIPVMRWIFKTAKAIPIAGARENPDVMQRAFDEVDAVLAEGELVCIFPEGALTKDGHIAPFKSGMERILQRAAARGQDVPVVPMALQNMWGSMWSRRNAAAGNGLLGRMRVPRRLRAPIEVHAAPPIAGHLATAATLEQHVRTLRGDAA
jgi:1-acyl-sn-glycerol-3-phosphate acyltransferase